MQGSNLGYQTWAIAIYLVTTNLKGVAAMKLHRDLEISYKSAWHLAHRLRKAFEDDGNPLFTGPVEADEAYLGGKRKNMPKKKRAALTGRGAVGKTIVVGTKDRESNKVAARVVENTEKPTLQGFIGEKTAPGAKVFTDESKSYIGMDFEHESVNHLGWRIRARDGSHERDRVFLGHAEARLSGHVPSFQREALRPLRERVCGAAQHPGEGHSGPNGARCPPNDRQAPAVSRSGGTVTCWRHRLPGLCWRGRGESGMQRGKRIR